MLGVLFLVPMTHSRPPGGSRSSGPLFGRRGMPPGSDHYAGLFVKICYEYACVLVLICKQGFRSSTDRADTFAPAAELRGDADHLPAERFARAHVSARDSARYNIVLQAIHCSDREGARCGRRRYSTFAPDSFTTLPHFSICAARCSPKRSRVPPTGSTP